MKKYIHIYILMLACLGLQAQDVHYSQYDVIKQKFNPALMGDMDYTYQLGADYRHQWLDFDYKYLTLQAEAMGKMQSGALRNLCGGVYFYYDEISKTGLSNFSVAVSGAYPIVVKNHNLSVGVQLGMIQRKVDLSSRTFPDQWQYETGTFTQNLPNNESFDALNKTMFDMSAGLSWTWKSKLGKLRTGAAFYHLNQPKDVLAGNNNRLRMSYGGHLSYAFYLKKGKYVLEPKVRYQNTANASEMLFGLEGNIVFNPKSVDYLSSALILGCYGRGGIERNYDAVIPFVGYRFRRLQVIVSDDLHLGKFANDFGTRQSIELSLVYVIPTATVNYHSIPCGIY